MTAPSEKIIEKAIQNPGKIYTDPKEILEDANLTAEQKEKVLENWRSDQNALLRADNENMAEQNSDNVTQSEDPAAMLARIEKAQRALEK